MTAAVLTMHSPVFVGAIAQLLGGADISWIVGFFVSLIAYEAMARGRA
jgi:purine-cytosine permease-like protein